MDLHHQPPDSESGALLFELQGYSLVIRQPELHRSLADTSGVRRYQRFGGVNTFKLERAPGLAPGKSGFAIRRLDDFSIARDT